MKSKPLNSQQPHRPPPPSPPSPSSSPPTELMTSPLEDLTSSTTYFQNPNPNNHQTTDSGISTPFNFIQSNFADSLISKRKYVKVKKHSNVSKPVVVNDNDSLNLGKTSRNDEKDSNSRIGLGKVESSGSDFVFGATKTSEANGTKVGKSPTEVVDSHLVDSLSGLNLGTGGGPMMNDNKRKTVENDASENVGFLFPIYQTTDSGISTPFNFIQFNFADSSISKRKYVKVKKHSSVSKSVVVDDSLNLGKTSPNDEKERNSGVNDEIKLGSKVESSGSDFVFGATNESEDNGMTVGTSTTEVDSHLVDSLSELNLGTGGGPLMNDNNKRKTVDNDASEKVGFLSSIYQKQESKVKSGYSVNDTLDSGVMFGDGEFSGGFQIGNQNDKERSTVKGRKKPAGKKKPVMSASSSFSSSSSSKKVILMSVEGESHEIDEKAASESLILKLIMEDKRDDNIMRIPFTSETILKVIAYCEKHANDEPLIDDKAILTYRSPYEKVDPAVEELKAFDVEFAKVDTDMVQDILLAANFLEILSLIELMTHTIADRIKGKTPEEIREILHIESDFTPEEEAALREEHAWAFE